MTVTGLNKLASVTSTVRLEDEILLVYKHTEFFETELNRVADDFARDPILLATVRSSNAMETNTILAASKIRLGVQHLEVIDTMGMSLGHQHQAGAKLDDKSMEELNALGRVRNETTELAQTPGGWFLVSARPLIDSGGIMGTLTVGRLIDFRALTEMNLDRSDTIMVLLGYEDEVVSASFPSRESMAGFSMAPNRESVRNARMGRAGVGWAIIDGKRQPTFRLRWEASPAVFWR